MKTFLQAPYHDDYDENKKFHRILSRPSYPVQARELTQSQTMLQHQIKRFGDHFFADGAQVVDGQVTFDTSIQYVRLRSIASTSGSSALTVSQFIGQQVYGTTSKVKAIIIAASEAEGNDPATLFVKYIASSANNGYDKFVKNEGLSLGEGYQVENSDTATGTGSIAQVARGYFYALGMFCLVDAQTIVLDKYSSAPSYRIGLGIKEDIVTPEDDASLADNAQGSYNFSAPGAHRYRVELVLKKVPLNSVDNDNFIELGQIQNGRILKQTTKTDYSEIEETLARRTHDESGDYTVRPFKISIREHRSNDRGEWKNSRAYLRGDIVRNDGNTYVARTSGTSLSLGAGPTHTVGSRYESTEGGGICWEHTEKPKFNNGVYPAEGRIASLEILDGGKGYISPPSVSILGGGGSGATAEAVVSEGKVVKLILTNGGDGYINNNITVVFSGGISGANSDTKVATAVAKAEFGKADSLAIGLEGGKAYVQGYEVEKVGTSFIEVPKARTYEQVSTVHINSNVGNFVYVTNLYGLPPFGSSGGSIGTIDLYDGLASGLIVDNAIKLPTKHGTKIGTARVRGIEWDSGVRSSVKSVYKLYIYDVKFDDPKKDFVRDVKSFRSGNEFFCNIEQSLTRIDGFVTFKDASTLTGSMTSFMTDVDVGDWLNLNGEFCRVTAVNGQNELKVTDCSEGFNATKINGAPIRIISTNIVDSQYNTALYKIPSDVVRSITNGTNSYDIQYHTMEKFSGEYVKVSDTDPKQIEVSVPSTVGGFFATATETDNYIVVEKKDGGNVVIHEVLSGTEPGKSTITLTLASAVSKSSTVTIMGTLIKSGIKNVTPKKKTLKQEVIGDKAYKITSEKEYKASVIQLNNADVHRIISVKMHDGKSTDVNDISRYTIDITDRYDLDDGQTENYYDISKLVLKPTYLPATAPIAVSYEYFAHGNGDYFCVDSYPSEIDYSEIKMRDYLDFRPTLNKDGTVASSSASLKRGTEITTSYSYYIPRRDKISIDFTGKLVNIEGVPSVNPQLPETPALAMNLYNLSIAPYTFGADSSNVGVETIDNRRYTMRDIGKLEKRISNLEEYTTLSLLEQATSSMSIEDSYGLERFKRGFVVDNFKDTTLLNVKDISTFCAMDIEEGSVRPPFIQQNVSLVENITNNGDRDKQNYMAYGKVFTLALDEDEPHVVLVEQGLASRTENINPFAVATFFGKIDINPSSDDWFETKYLPEIVNQVEGNYLQTKSSLEGTVWGSWQTTWTGKENETSKTFSNWSYTSSSWRKVDVTRTYSQDSTERRTGIKTTVTSKIDYEEVDDRVVSTSEIPYMRSRYLLVKARGLKPYTRFYPFFDNVDIDYWCTPCSAIEYESLSNSDFDCESSAGSDYANKARIIETTKNSYWAEETDKTCLDIGDVITSSSSTGEESLTAVVVGKSIDGETGKKYLYVANIKKESGAPLDGRATQTASAKTFASGDIIIGSLSGAQGRIKSAQPNLSHINDPLVTNHAGELYFLYWIPDGDRVDYNTTGATSTSASLQFRTGDRVLSLTDSDGKGVLPSSSAEAVYSATGILTTRQKTSNAVRNAVITQENLSEDRTVTNTWSTTVRETMYVDPLAQTFMVDCDGGCFLSKVDVYFASKDANLPVKLQIRTVENGYPSSKVLAFGEVVKNPYDVHLSVEKNASNTVTYQNESGVTITESDYNTPTTFEFESPVYVEDKTEYCIVLLSDSTKYRVWVAGIGDSVPGTNMVISKQPYNGVLFKSQNASTWTADQTQDLKFRIHRANFKTNVYGNIEFKANTPSMVYLDANSIQTKKGSNLVRIWQPHHGMFEGASTRIVYDDMNDIDAKVYATGSLDSTVGKTSRKTVKGIKTKFTTECDIGSTIYIETANQSSETILVGVVESIQSDTELTLTTDSPEYATATKFYIRKSFNGIPHISICKLHNGKVTNVDSESFVITVDDAVATESGYCGDANLKISRNVNYDIIQPSVTSQTFSETSIGYTVEATNGHSVDSNSDYEDLPTFSVTVNDNNYLPHPLCVYSEENKNAIKDDLILNVTFESKNPSLSPIIDGDRVSALLINNVINDPTQANTNVVELDNEDIEFTDGESYTLTGGIVGFRNLVGGKGYTAKTLSILGANGVESVAKVEAVVENGEVTDIIILDSGSGYSTAMEDSADFKFSKSDSGASGFSAKPVVKNNQIVVSPSSPLADVTIGKQITVLNKLVTVVDKGVLNPSSTTDKKIVLYVDKDWEVADLGVRTNTISVHTLYVDEISPIGGTCVAKYITKEISLDGLCDYLRVAYSANCPFDSNIDVYCKSYIGSSGDESYDNTPWVKMESTAPITKVGVNEETFYDVSYSKEGMKAFDRLAIKLVFRGTNSSTVPRVRDLRVIACA